MLIGMPNHRDWRSKAGSNSTLEDDLKISSRLQEVAFAFWCSHSVLRIGGV